VPGALSDIRVIDLTVARAGPTCVRQLADWGADVIRVDQPKVALAFDSNRLASDFQNLHRNKRSIVLDLKSAEGIEILHRMVRTADVVVENMRPPVKHRLGVDYESLRAVNPRIVYGSISGFGQDGPYGDRGGVDQIAQGLSGLMSVTGLPGQGPVRSGAAITDVAAGVYLSFGIVAALHERERSGEGQWVYTSLLEAGLGLMDFQITRWTIEGEDPPQAGNHHPTHAPMGCFATADGYVNIAGAGGNMMKSFLNAIDASELLDDPRFDTGAKRLEHRDLLNTLIEERVRTNTTEHWVRVLNEVGVPCGPVYTVAEAFADPQVQHLGMAEPVQHPEMGELRLLRNPVTMSRSTRDIEHATPEAGEHTDEVLTELGLSGDEIAGLRQRAVVR
jgi:formyl-CoA transferase